MKKIKVLFCKIFLSLCAGLFFGNLCSAHAVAHVEFYPSFMDVPTRFRCDFNDKRTLSLIVWRMKEVYKKFKVFYENVKGSHLDVYDRDIVKMILSKMLHDDIECNLKGIFGDTSTCALENLNMVIVDYLTDHFDQGFEIQGRLCVVLGRFRDLIDSLKKMMKIDRSCIWIEWINGSEPSMLVMRTSFPERRRSI